MLSSHARKILIGLHTKPFVLIVFSRFSGPKLDEERQTRATGKGQAHLLFLRPPSPSPRGLLACPRSPGKRQEKKDKNKGFYAD